jgi:hypothetical protein
MHQKVKKFEVRGSKAGVKALKRNVYNELSYKTPSYFNGVIDVDINEISLGKSSSRNERIQPPTIAVRALSSIEHSGSKSISKVKKLRYSQHSDRISMISSKPVATIELNMFETDDFIPNNKISLGESFDKSKIIVLILSRFKIVFKFNSYGMYSTK